MELISQLQEIMYFFLFDVIQGTLMIEVVAFDLYETLISEFNVVPNKYEFNWEVFNISKVKFLETYKQTFRQRMLGLLSFEEMLLGIVDPISETIRAEISNFCLDLRRKKELLLLNPQNDILDLLDKVLPRVDLVIHCAANSNTRACHSNMMIDLEDGIKTTWVLAEKLIEHKCKRVIFFLKSACLWQ